MPSKGTALISLTGFAAGAVAAVLTGSGKPADTQATQPPTRTAPAVGRPSAIAAPGRNGRFPDIPLNADDRTFRALVEQELAEPEPDQLHMQALLMRWFGRSPDLWATYQELRDRFPAHHTVLSKAFYTAWAFHDLEAAHAKVRAGNWEGWHAVWAVACALGHPAVLQPGPQLRAMDFSAARRLVKRDPSLGPVMMERALASGPHDEELLPLAITRGWAESAPLEALSWLSEGHQNADMAWFDLAALMWLRKDPGALGKIPGPLRARLEQRKSFRRLAGLADLNGEPPDTGHMLGILARLDPCMPLGDIVRTGVNPWPDNSPSSLYWTTMQDMPTGFKTDPRGALDSILATEPTAGRDAFARIVIRSWSQWDFEAASRHAESHHIPPPKRYREPKLLSLPEIEEAASVGKPGQYNVPIYESLKSGMEQDAAGTLNWLERKLTDPQADQEVWTDMAHNASLALSGTDLPAATQWADRLPQGAAREAVIEGLIPALSSYDPLAALAWTESSADPAKYAHQVFQGFIGRIGPAGARIFIRDSRLPQTVKDELLSKESP